MNRLTLTALAMVAALPLTACGHDEASTSPADACRWVLAHSEDTGAEVVAKEHRLAKTVSDARLARSLADLADVTEKVASSNDLGALADAVMAYSAVSTDCDRHGVTLPVE